LTLLVAGAGSNRRPWGYELDVGKEQGFAFLEVAAAKNLRWFYIPSQWWLFPIPHVLFIPSTNWPQLLWSGSARRIKA